MPTIPRRTSDFTAEWLTEVFSDVGMAAPRIAALDVSRVGEGAGFAGRALRLSVSYEGPADQAPTSLIAKMPSGAPTVREMMAKFRGYELEGRFYGELAAESPVPVPRCYWNGMQLDTGDFLLLLEDLEGYTDGKQVGDEPSLKLVEELVRIAARFHARWWNAPELLSNDWIPTPGGDVAQYYQALAVEGVDAFQTRFADSWPDDQLEKLGIAMDHAVEIEVAAASGTETLVHGDYRLDNAMYAWNRERPVVVIDWQLLTRGSGPYDLSYLFGQSLPIEFRRTHESALLALYLTELQAAGVTQYEEERLRHDYALGLVLAARLPLNGSRNIRATIEQIESMPLGETRDAYERANSAYIRLVETIAERQLAALLDHDALAVAIQSLG